LPLFLLFGTHTLIEVRVPNLNIFSSRKHFKLGYRAFTCMSNYKAFYDNTFNLLRAHHDWFTESLPLIASENVPSPAVREALSSDLGNRYAEGWPGERVYAGCTYIDKIELLAIEEAKKIFQCEFVDVRPVSGVCANLAIYTAFTSPGDYMMCLSIPSGGHISTGKLELGGTAGAVHGLKTEYFPFDYEDMNIDVDKTINKIKELEKAGINIKLAMFGGSVLLFPQPLKELASIFKERGASICYDAAHVIGLIAGKKFQDPLREGADVITCSTHKTLFGPQGGMILSFDAFSEKIKKAVFPGNVSNHHLHSVAGKAIAFAEVLEFGESYAEQIIKNAKALANALNNEGLKVVGEKRGFTNSHIVLVEVTKFGLGGDLERKLEQANIICNRNLLPWDIKEGRHFANPGGLRFGVSELTRLGMKESEMVIVAEYIADIIEKGKDEGKRFQKRLSKDSFLL
jgi:glycine hydroxymethyltransferase